MNDVPRHENSVRCTESVSGCDTGGRRDGRCTWCLRRIGPPAPAPRLSGWRTDAGQAYRRHYDPDYGTDPKDY